MDQEYPKVSSGDENSHSETDGSSQINARVKIVDILTRVETKSAFTDKLLEAELEQFNGADRGLITEVVNGTLRWRYRLDWYLSQLYVGEYENLIPDVKNNLRSSAYQLMFLDKVPPYAVLNEAVEIAKTCYNQKTANLVNAILRNYLRQQKKLEYVEIKQEFLDRLAIAYSHPHWLLQHWIEQWGVDDTVEMCKFNNERPILAVRVNQLLTTQDIVVKVLEDNNLLYEIHADFPEFIQIDDFSELRKLDLLQSGSLVVQDISTGIPVRLLNPQAGEDVLDICAAPGGKFSYIAAMMNNQGLLLGVDKHQSRVNLLYDNLQRLGIENAMVAAVDALELPELLKKDSIQWRATGKSNETSISEHQKFDKILLDAPCSGLGVLSKRVDLKWKRDPKDFEKMQQLQLKLLETATKLLKPGGVIVYSTCTVEIAENETVIEKFLQRCPDFELENLEGKIPEAYLWTRHTVRTFPHRHKMDGSFVVRLLHNLS